MFGRNKDLLERYQVNEDIVIYFYIRVMFEVIERRCFQSTSVGLMSFINFIFLAIIMYHDMKDQEVVPGVWRGCWCCWRGSPWGSSRQRCQCPGLSPV